MEKNLLVYVLCFFTSVGSIAQPQANSRIHAHNDYEQADPFYNAYKHQVGSIEADIFERNGDLFVAHNASDIRAGRTLENLYLMPLNKAIEKNDGKVFLNSTSTLIFLIDFKTPGDRTMSVLTSQLEKYPSLTGATLKIVISGSMPDTSTWSKLPGYILFDGRPYIDYNKKSLGRVFMISDSFLRYAKQDKDKFEVDTLKVQSAIQQAQLNRKLFRFWATPDTKEMWQQLVQWEVDLISTDNVDELSNFLAGKQ